MTLQDRLNQLEKLIDEGSIPEVIEEIGIVCREKANHIQQSYDDQETAQIWYDYASQMSKFSTKLEKL